MVGRAVIERWRTIAKNPRYEISDAGRVRNAATGAIFCPSRHSRGYLQVQLKGDGGRREYYTVHRLVADAFLEENLAGRSQVNHLDGDKTNNAATNLEWATQSENIRHGYSTGAYPAGDAHHFARHSEETVEAVRRRRAEGVGPTQLAAEFGIPKQTIEKWIYGIKRNKKP